MDSTAASTLALTFAGTSAVLALKDPSGFAASIAGFAPTDTIDLLKIKATSATLGPNDTLVVTNGTTAVANLKLSGTYTGDTFTTVSDGHAGQTSPSPPPPLSRRRRPWSRPTPSSPPWRASARTPARRT